MTGYEHIEHTFAPVYDADSLVLILGTLPSVKSRENHFYYGHKQNRFWKVMADLCGEPVPETIEEKKKMLLTHHIAIWDVIQSCDIKGSSDSSIRNVKPTDIRRILAESQITRIYANGNKAEELYLKIQLPLTGHRSHGAAIHQPGQCGMEAGEFVRSVAGDDSTFIIFEKTTKMKVLLTIHEMFYII